MDLSDESLPEEASIARERFHLLPLKRREENLNLAFRAISFFAAISIGVYFLFVGLDVAKESADHIRKIQTSAIEIKKEQLQFPLVIRAITESGKGKVVKDTDNKKDSKNETNVSNNNDNFLFSTGSLITLIAFIFGVGLTLLLSVLKFVFIKNEDKGKVTSPDIATPVSELIKGLADWLKKKAS